LSKILEVFQDRLHCLCFCARQNVYEKGMRSYVSVGVRVGNGQNITTTPTRAQYFGTCLFLVPVLVLDILDNGKKFLLFFLIWSLVKPISRQEQNAVSFPFLVPGLLIFLDKGGKFLLFFQSGLWSSQYLDKSKMQFHFFFWSLV
jgi:hypothetical protein